MTKKSKLAISVMVGTNSTTVLCRMFPFISRSSSSCKATCGVHYKEHHSSPIVLKNNENVAWHNAHQDYWVHLSAKICSSLVLITSRSAFISELFLSLSVQFLGVVEIKVAVGTKWLPILWAAAPIFLCIDRRPEMSNIKEKI